jgi:oxygen-independent coproporphyrinogen-3 oxidase
VTGLYVHLPFCETKCPYCDFNSYTLAGRDVDGYLAALRAEMDARGVPSRPATIYVGGGTPTVVAPDQLARYLEDLVARVKPDPAREFTVEANPGSLTAEKVAILAECGVNRVTLGAQSLSARTLRTLGRVHTPAQVAEAVALVRGGGIAQLSLDFIYGVPGQTLRDWVGTLERALLWGADHLSCYALTYEPGTEFFARRAAGRLRPVGEGSELAMFRWTERRLRRAGLTRYEISNFAAPGKECRHNMNYWTNGSYVGFGAGAFSYVGGARLGNERDLARYVAGVRARGEAIVFREQLAGLAAAREMVVLGLRTAAGVDLEAVSKRFGLDARQRFQEVIGRLETGGFVRSDGRLRLDRRGWRVADEVAVAFL